MIDVAYEDDNLRIAVVDNLTVAVWFDAPSVDQMRTLDRVDKRMRREASGGYGFLNVIISGVPRFSQEVREEARRQVALEDERDLAAGHLILLEGIAGSAVRAFLSTVFLLARPKYPTRVFSDPRAAARWLADAMDREDDVRWTRERMARVIDSLIHPLGTERPDLL